MNEFYAKEVARLRASSADVIFNSWFGSALFDERPRSPLFAFITPSGLPESPDGVRSHVQCGCLTQIKAGVAPAWTTELAVRIRNDARLPSSPNDVTPEHLEVFAEWQEKIDAEIRPIPLSEIYEKIEANRTSAS